MPHLFCLLLRMSNISRSFCHLCAVITWLNVIELGVYTNAEQNERKHTVGVIAADVSTENHHVEKNIGKMVEDIPLIIWWTERLYLNNGINKLSCTSGSKCYVTKDRRYMKNHRARGFYFYGTDIDPFDLPVPKKSWHEWALFHEESPMNNYMLSHGATIKLFNHTATFKRQSDFPLTTHHIPDLTYITKRLPVPIDLKNVYRREGLAPIAYIQSHCDVASDRDRYVEELMKYVKIDAYGKCLHNKDLPIELRDPVESMEAEGFLSLISRYKFILSYENAICDDYMTEKLFRTFHVGSVPIYKGSPKVRDWIPDEDAIILIDDFETPEKLAQYILYLDEFDFGYQKFLDYKEKSIKNEKLVMSLTSRKWAINHASKPDMLHDFECYLCDQLVKRFDNEKANKDDSSKKLLLPKIADSSHLSCPQPYPSYGDITQMPKSDKWMKQNWIDDYWFGLDKGLALQRMLLANETNSAKFESYLQY